MPRRAECGVRNAHKVCIRLEQLVARFFYVQNIIVMAKC